MVTIAGTPVEHAADDDRARTVLVSDLHIPDDGGEPFEMFERLLEDAASVGDTCRVIVLGDLFDAYIGPKQARVGVWKRTVDTLVAAADRGVSITLLHGNRDYMLDQDFAALAGCRVVAGGLRIELDGQPGLLLHGDELCQRDLPYQRAKKFLRHPMTKALLRRLPLGFALRLAARARNRSEVVIGSGDQTRFDPVATAIDEAFASGADLLVFGHIHRPARGPYGADGKQYAILPAFDTEGVHLVHAAGRLSYRSVSGLDIPDYPPREFC